MRVEVVVIGRAIVVERQLVDPITHPVQRLHFTPTPDKSTPRGQVYASYTEKQEMYVAWSDPEMLTFQFN